MPRAKLQWPQFTASDLIARKVLYVGDGYRAKNSEMGPTGLPFARAGNINGGFLFDGADLLDEGNVPKAGNKVSVPADIVFTSKGTVGRFAFVRPSTPKFVYSPQLCFWRVLDSSVLDARFLLYWMQSSGFLSQVQQVKGLTDMADYVSLSDQRRMTLTIPPLPVQSQIASILSAYDDLIENNTRRIKVVKAIAQTIFQGALFTFPDLWANVPIEEVYEELFDGPHATPKPSASGPIYLGIKNVTERGELDLTGIRHIAEEDFSQWTRRVVPRPGDIVFTYEATLNRYAIINRDFRGCLGRRMALIRPNERQIDPYLLLHCLLSDQWRDEVRSKIISGATVDRIPLTTFPTFRVQVPTLDLMARIGPAVRACEELAENCRRRNDVLRTTRDFLLPKLISGEIPVEAAAELVEQTA
jgi:type I restriction enzyme S subunit